ncbi:chromate transporter, partial [Klebsiella variicola]|uniref:chromate transporter n=1 Tax=Klebsiella variicola TaxID=244366 RepID=UPI002731328E
MHRFLVDRMAWLSDSEFTASIALAQAAPGPNILFVAVLGYNVAGLAGAAASMAGILLPSTVLTLTATRWARANR